MRKRERERERERRERERERERGESKVEYQLCLSTEQGTENSEQWMN